VVNIKLNDFVGNTLQISFTPAIAFCYHVHALNADSRDGHGQDWIRTEANFGRIRTGSDCNFFKIGVPGLDRTKKIFVVLM